MTLRIVRGGVPERRERSLQAAKPHTVSHHQLHNHSGPNIAAA